MCDLLLVKPSLAYIRAYLPAIYWSPEAVVRKVGSSPDIDSFADIARAFAQPIYH